MEIRLISKLVESIIKSFENDYDNWELGEFTLKNQSKRFHIWVSNGWMFVKVYHPLEVSPSFIERIVLWKAYKKIRDKKLCELLKEK